MPVDPRESFQYQIHRMNGMTDEEALRAVQSTDQNVRKNKAIAYAIIDRESDAALKQILGVRTRFFSRDN